MRWVSAKSPLALHWWPFAGRVTLAAPSFAPAPPRKARVFNRDYGLVGEGLGELNLAFGERAHFAAPN